MKKTYVFFVTKKKIIFKSLVIFEWSMLHRYLLLFLIIFLISNLKPQNTVDFPNQSRLLCIGNIKFQING